MRSFRNNNKRSRYRSNGDRNFKRNGESHSYAGNTNFQRRSPGRNNQNASQLIEKYTDLAREALSNGDKILSENYFQHVDHFLRITNEKNNDQIKIATLDSTNMIDVKKFSSYSKDCNLSPTREALASPYS